MILDSSAVIAILLREPGFDHLLDAIDRAATVAIGAPTLAGAGLVLAARLKADSRSLLARFLEEAGAAVLAFGPEHAREAIGAYRDIKVRTPALTLVNLQLGNAYVLKKSYPEAETAFQEILKNNADDPNGLFAMGTVKEAEGNAADAASWYQKASTADAFWTRPLMKLAALARQGGDKTGAVRYLSKVIDLDPGSTDAAQALSLQKQLQ